MDNTIKSLTITGSAAEDAMKPRRSGSRRAPRRPTEQANQEGESEFLENAKRIVFGTSRHSLEEIPPRQTLGGTSRQSLEGMPPRQSLQPNPVAQRPVELPKPIRPIPLPNPSPSPSPIPIPIQNPIQEGGKVILNPPKHQRVKLQPKMPHQQNQSSVVTNQTRKARRIHLTNLTHRFTRAKRVCDDTEKKPMDSIRQYLIQKGVIQAKSRAPEKMLRSMYSDFMLLKDQAL